ncbi:CCA tRNA nucleotidyltransferase [Kordiimonas laminariae]|uniref:CCA tRNA nucleotidyltransferase n=1 Tax=Kordiimonas laminariae TaxID=2917717 RepID=UPI001FF0EF13|nr:CCA tRNA nucleotidyltransferase [Kordiimonas laminariae]MCK0068563.1 CCA tRNA nucleotidyltransferase [Kordiimonas laminariae]
MTQAIHLKADWLCSQGVERVVEALGAEAIKFVGGAVRDTLAGRHVSDIDAATTHKPEITMALLEEAGIKVIPTGLKHGTVTAVSSGTHIEITTLRVDVETDGRHAEVAFTESWLEDAKRRDFTINSLYCAPDGELFDPFGGIEDLKIGRVRFIGDAEERIKEDALRIMRFFRFTARYGQGEPDKAGMKACSSLRYLLDALSIERIRDELMKMMALPNFIQPVFSMWKAGVLQQIYGDAFRGSNMELLSMCEASSGLAADALARFYMLGSSVFSAQKLAKKFKLSNEQRKQLIGLEIAGESEASFEQLLYELGPWVMEQHVICSGSKDYARELEICRNWVQPVFPLQGKDLLDRGFEAGPDLGRRMRELEQIWIDSGFKLSKEDLLATLNG